MPAGNSAVAVLGGAFDPPHAGHTHLARAALTDFPVREVRILPNGDPRHRGVCAPWSDRVAMCELAFAGINGAVVRRDESPGVARYSAETLRAMRQVESDTALIFIVGADAFSQLESWREWRTLFDWTHFAVAPRGNELTLSPALADFCAGRFCDNPSELAAGCGKILRWNVRAPRVSSSELREQLGLGKKGVGAGDGLIPLNVLEYACERALYGF